MFCYFRYLYVFLDIRIHLLLERGFVVSNVLLDIGEGLVLALVHDVGGQLDGGNHLGFALEFERGADVVAHLIAERHRRIDLAFRA